MTQDVWYSTDHPAIIFENGTSVGELKKRIWNASDEDISDILDLYGVPGASELGRPGSYIQTSVRQQVIAKRRKNDVVLVPVGSTENHGIHANSGFDILLCTQLCEAVRRRTAAQGHEVALAYPALSYGGHPYQHIGIAGNVILPDEVVRETVVNVLLGLWDDGFRKIVLVNGHGQRWMLEGAIQEFFKRFQLPAVVSLVEWNRSVREFFMPTDRPDSMETHFVHADEAETSAGLLLFPDMIDMSIVVDATPKSYGLAGHYDNTLDNMRRPHSWSEGHGHNWIEALATPEAVVGHPSYATAAKARRPVAAALEYLTLLVNEILEMFPPGEVPVEGFTFRSREDLEPYLREPQSDGWKSVHQLPRIGVFG
jgi:3-dehydro-scyllo-inosose hydrolase